MVPLRIEISATAEKQLRRLERKDQVRVVTAIRKLALNPRPKGHRKLRDYADLYRLRVGVMRVIYSIEDDRLLIVTFTGS
jgi:mRNA interferase RelE/StbE